jgi:hypothetical protein
MFRTKCATISPTWTFSCQKIADPIGSVAIFAAHPPDYVRFRANGSHQLIGADPRLRRSVASVVRFRSCGCVEVGCASPARAAQFATVSWLVRAYLQDRILGSSEKLEHKLMMRRRRK